MEPQQYEQRGYLREDFRLFHLKDSRAQKLDYHYHEFDKLVIFLGGKVTYVVEGVTYFLKPWDIVLIQHNLIHRPIIHAEEPYERAVLWPGWTPPTTCGTPGSMSAPWTRAGSRGSTFCGLGRRGVLATHGSSSS